MMAARTLGEMHIESERARGRASGYAMAGERELAGLAKAAADRLGDAVEAVRELERAEREARERARHA